MEGPSGEQLVGERFGKSQPGATCHTVASGKGGVARERKAPTGNGSNWRSKAPAWRRRENARFAPRWMVGSVGCGPPRQVCYGRFCGADRRPRRHETKKGRSLRAALLAAPAHGGQQAQVQAHDRQRGGFRHRDDVGRGVVGVHGELGYRGCHSTGKAIRHRYGQNGVEATDGSVPRDAECVRIRRSGEKRRVSLADTPCG